VIHRLNRIPTTNANKGLVVLHVKNVPKIIPWLVKTVCIVKVLYQVETQHQVLAAALQTLASLTAVSVSVSVSVFVSVSGPLAMSTGSMLFMRAVSGCSAGSVQRRGARGRSLRLIISSPTNRRSGQPKLFDTSRCWLHDTMCQPVREAGTKSERKRCLIA